MNFRKIILFGCLFLISFCSTQQIIDHKEQQKPTLEEPAPKLVVFISVDQMRYDYFERFAQLFEGGLNRLWTEGTVFTAAYHNHKPSNTAPGHAVLSTGKYPSHHGIVSNGFYDPETKKNVYCVEDLDVSIVGVDNDGNLPGRSPKNLKATTLGDWIKANNSKSKVISISKKDRSAVLMGGKNPDHAFWFDDISTNFVSSTYYGKYPKWAKKFVGKKVMEKELATGWRKKAEEEVYQLSREDDYEFEMGTFVPSFPHTLDRTAPGFPPSRKAGMMLSTSPLCEDMMLRFADIAIKEYKLGKDKNTDILFLGFSAADAIGHHFGPYSHEAQDYYLHLDEYLDNFFKELDQKYGRENYWVSLSADHGVMPLPEELARRGVDSKRISYIQLNKDIKRIEAELRIELGLKVNDTIFANIGDRIELNYKASVRKNISQKQLRNMVAAKIKNIEYIDDVFTRDEMENGSNKPYAELFQNSHHQVLGSDLYILKKENYLIHSKYGTTHGSPYAYDTHVPMIFLGRPFEAKKIDQKAFTVDIAPTLADYLGIEIPSDLDGVSRKSNMK